MREQRRFRISDDGIIILFTSVLYLGVGVWLAGQDIVLPDATSRVADGYFAVFSRDPHLTASDFLRGPLPSLATIPLLLFAPVVPVLAAKSFAGVLASVFCGVLAMVLARRLLVLFGMGGGAALVLTGILAVQPLILLPAAVGASEPMLLAVALYATLSLTRWLRKDDPWHLVHVGSGLGLAYLVRHEAAAAVAATVVLVLVVSWWRSRGGRRTGSLFLLDCSLAGGPFVAAFALWALASRMVTGSWFTAGASWNGEAAQVAEARVSVGEVTGGSLDGALTYLSAQLLAVAPLAILFIAVAMVIATWRRDAGVLGPAAVLGGILAIEEWAFLSGWSFGWLRFQLMAVSWGVLMAGYVLGALRDGAGRLVFRRVTAWVVLIATLVPLPVAWWAVTDPHLAREEQQVVEVARSGQHATQVQAAAYLDSLDLPEGSVITDTTYSFPIVLASRRPRQFVITPDRDFREKLDDPVAGRVRYALVTDPQRSPADAVAARFPGIHENGAGVASLERQWIDGRGVAWRLYAFSTTP